MSLPASVSSSVSPTPVGGPPSAMPFANAACAPVASPSAAAAPPAQAKWPCQVFAPIVDIGLTAPSGPFPQFDFCHAADDLNVPYFVLGHVTGDDCGAPNWGGYRLKSPWDRGLRQQIALLRERGGDVAISFGGVNSGHAELACVINDIHRLTATYNEIVAAYGVRRIDLDIDASAADDTTIVERRATAIAHLQELRATVGQPLSVWYTVPGTPGGIASCDLHAIEAALVAGVDLHGINLSTMNFGAAIAPHPEGQMGRLAVMAARTAFGQVRELFTNHGRPLSESQMWARLGVTPMIGQNDNRAERFSPRDARVLYDFAITHGLGQISMWSLNRDANTGGANYDCSGIEQQPFDFARIFAPLTNYAGR